MAHPRPSKLPSRASIIFEQRHFYANADKAEVRHFSFPGTNPVCPWDNPSPLLYTVEAQFVPTNPACPWDKPRVEGSQTKLMCKSLCALFACYNNNPKGFVRAALIADWPSVCDTALFLGNDCNSHKQGCSAGVRGGSCQMFVFRYFSGTSC